MGTKCIFEVLFFSKKINLDLHTLVTGSSVTCFHPVPCLYFGLGLANDSGVTATPVKLFHH